MGCAILIICTTYEVDVGENYYWDKRMLSRHLAIPSSTHWSIWLTSRPVSSRCLRKAEFQLDRHRKMVVLLRWSLGARCRLRYSSSSIHFATTSATPDRTLVEVMPEWFWLLISSGTKNATNLHGQSRSCAWAPLLGYFLENVFPHTSISYDPSWTNVIGRILGPASW